MGWSQRRIELPAGRYETLLPPSAVSDLMIYLYWTMEARDADEGRNVFARPGGGNRIGERLADAAADAAQRPRARRGWRRRRSRWSARRRARRRSSTTAWPRRRSNWIENGVLTNLIRPRAWALRTTAPATAAVDNLILEDPTATATLEEMVAATERGLLLTTLWYIREVDPQTLLLTGLTRDGVFLVEDGEVTGAVNNFRFNESPVDLLGRAVAGRAHRADPAARVERLVHPRRDAAAAGAGLQHEQRQPGQLTPEFTALTPLPASGRLPTTAPDDPGKN